ncbi:MAG: rRNA pseudouridine synthase [Planctomycetota bacterium]|nr:MAG: rRNA pseudouridine synthase [Planctomycetota bacterium]
MSKRAKDASGESGATVRIQKFLSDAGVASRRHAEELVRSGRVLVNDTIVDELPVFVDPQHDRVIVDGRRVRPQRHEYFILHKPRGFVCTNRDPGGRRRVIDLLPRISARVFPVGRLDLDSSGLLILTNDGELAQQIAHPRYGLPKVYHVEVRGAAPPDIAEKLEAGVHRAEGKARASGARVLHRSRERTVLTLTLREGRNRMVRRLLAKLGHPVRRLKRVRIGPIELKRLPEGACRRLSLKEVDLLREAVRQNERIVRPRRNVGRGARPRARKPKSRAAARKTSTPAGAGKGGKKRKMAKTDTPRRKRRVIS